MAISYQTPDPSVKPWDSSRLGWLVLTSFPAFGSRTYAKLHKLTNGDGGAALNISHDFIVAMSHTEKIADRFLTYRNQTSATQLAERLDREQIQFVLRGDPEYPPLLEQSADPPQALFLRGETSALSRKSVALVGTRAATSYGRFVTAELGHALARSGFSVVSGLALGIDSAAHEATLDADGTCVAVLGTGVNDRSIYPRTNAKLATRIMENGGAILSEFPPGTEGHKHHFPLRNRIIAALATTVVIIEADEKSGSLITAKLALDENRDVYAVPGPITSPRSRGTNLLISQGAIRAWERNI
jgi:DNA processing protein